MDRDDGQAAVAGSAPRHQPATTCAKPRARQVAARYLQPKAPTSASAQSGASSGGLLTGRASLAGYGSTGWIELQHPNHAATPLMVPTGSVGLSGCSSTARASRSRSGAPLPTPASTRQPTQQRQQQQQALDEQFVTPGPPATALAGPRTAGRSVHATATASALHSRQQHCLQTPKGFTMSAAISRPDAAGTAARPTGFSADLTAALSAQPKAAEDDMRAKLSRWKESKQQQSGRAGAKPAVFKQPAPKPTLFRATAATRASKDPTTARKASAAPVRAPAPAERASSVAGPSTRGVAGGSTAVQSPAAAGSATESSTAAHGTPVAAGSPSAFTATMATLQQSGSKGRKSSSSKAATSRPSPVPLLRLDQAGIGSSSPAAARQQQQYQQQQQASVVACSPLVGSATKIPKLNLSSLAGQHQHQPHLPLSSRWPSSSGGTDAALPDATPLSVRDALPSKLPRTPRMTTPTAGHQQAARASSTPDGDDHHTRQLDTSKAGLEQQQHSSSSTSPYAAAGKQTVPKLKLGALLAGKATGQDAAADVASHGRAAPGGSCLSARLPSGAAGRGAAQAAAHATAQASQLPGTPAGRQRTSSDGATAAAAGTPASAKQRGRTPRGPAPVARLPTPRALASSMAAAPPSASAAVPAAKRSDTDKAEEVRQQLRLLRMQRLQLQHLNARMEAAAKAKQEKIDATIAAATAAVVDLSGQLLRLKAQAMQSGWQSQLDEVLQQQHLKLQAWSQAQVQHRANVSQLQAACSSALSHVPLLNGATVGHNPDQPDLQALQRQLQQGMQLLGELQPALQLLMTGDTASSSSSSSMLGVTAGGGASSEGAVCRNPAAQPVPQEHLHPKGIKDTAALSRELMAVAEEECGLLQQLSQQLAELSDLQLYVNSMQVQLLHMKEAAADGDF